jgi:hypothetical protein
VRIKDAPSYDRHDGYRPSYSRKIISKESIDVPDTILYRPTAAERFIGSIMSGSSGSIHGLTGKALVYFTTLFVSLGVFLFGYDQGVMSGIIT